MREVERVKGIEPSLSAWEALPDGVSYGFRVYPFAPQRPGIRGFAEEWLFHPVSPITPLFQANGPQ